MILKSIHVKDRIYPLMVIKTTHFMLGFLFILKLGFLCLFFLLEGFYAYSNWLFNLVPILISIHNKISFLI